MDYEYLGDALEDAIKALEFALNKSQREPAGMCFNDVGRSIETIKEMKEQIEISKEATKRYRGRDKP